MDHEKNADSILELDKQIQELERAIAQLKRTRNSLLNITMLIPPEILGKIFCWSQSTSYNFLFVCHHWFEVASHTPGLRSSWGKTLRDWERRHVCFRTGLLDLELEHAGRGRLDGSESLLNAIRDRAAQDMIREVSLESDDSSLLDSIISAITFDDPETRSSRIEAFTVRNNDGGRSAINLSNFFQHRLPSLRRLCLSGRCQVSSWSSLGLQTTRLTTLSLKIEGNSTAPTTSQLLSILSSNPSLRHLDLFRGAVPNFDGSTSKLSLPSLRKLQLKGYSRNIFGLLNILELPDKMDEVRFFLDDCSRLDLSQTLGRYLGDLVRRRGWSREGLGLWVHPGESRYHLFAGDVTELHGSTHVNWFVIVGVAVRDRMPGGKEASQLSSTLIEQLPLSEVVYLRATVPVLALDGPCAGMTNLVKLHLEDQSLPARFVGPPLGESQEHEEPFPSLKYLSVSRYVLGPDDWSPFVAFLSRRASIGRRIASLVIEDWSDIPQEEEKCIRTVVEDFKVGDPRAP